MKKNHIYNNEVERHIPVNDSHFGGCQSHDIGMSSDFFLFLYSHKAQNEAISVEKEENAR